MDRRQKKSRTAIFAAFSKLLEQKRYEHITVQDIIDRADIGRSTFYAHFETKDMLLKEMCSDIFDHIFIGSTCGEKHNHSERECCDCSCNCDKSISCKSAVLCRYETGTPDLEAKLAHILYHLKDSKSDIVGILSSESADLFMRYLKEYLAKLFSMYISDFDSSVPDDFRLNLLVGSFSSAIKWWIKEGMRTSPEQTAKYYMEIICKKSDKH